MIEKGKDKARQNGPVKCKQNMHPVGNQTIKNDVSNLWCTFWRDHQGLNDIKVLCSHKLLC